MKQPYTVHRMEIKPSLKLLNAAVGLAGRLGLPFGRLDPDSILRTARRRTGLDDWGDEAFIDVMDKLIAFADAARPTPLGEVALRQTAYAAVCNRLFIEDYIARHPEVEDVPIERPIFIVGFPRTGTTLLQNLLSQEAGARALSFWELYTPVPVSDDRDEDRRLRVRKASRVLDMARFVAPEMPIVHDTRADTKEECWYLFANTFAVLNMDLASGVTMFGSWLLQHDMTGPYREYKRMLQLMAHWEPTRQFVLKCPEHLWFLDALFEVFPDACIVWPHRDPVSCVSSYSSMISLTRRAWYGRIHSEAIGVHISERFLQGVERGMAARDRHGAERFFDIRFDDLVADPVAAARDIKRHFGIAHTEDGERAMRAWLALPREDRPGKHVYSASQWALDPDRLRRRFSAYIDQVGLDVP